MTHDIRWKQRFENFERAFIFLREAFDRDIATLSQQHRMSNFGLTEREQEFIRGVFRRHSEITCVQIFGSRAKGDNRSNSDVDLALWGKTAIPLLARINAESC